MRHIKFYKTKAKWNLYHEKGIPLTGYDHACRMTATGNDDIVKADAGQNVLVYGRLYMTGTARGRSAAKFAMVSPKGDEFTMTLTGAEKLFVAVADGRMSTQMDIWVEDHHWMDNAIEHDVPSFTGYWTVAKQGTDYSLIPAPANIIP